MVQGYCTLFTKMHYVGKVWARLVLEKRRYAPDKKFKADRRIEGQIDGRTNGRMDGQMDRAGP